MAAAGLVELFPQDDLDAEGMAPPPEAGPSLVNLDLNIRLDEETEHKFVRRVCDDLYAYRSATDNRRQLLRQWRRDWEVMPPGIEGPWENSSDVPSPYTRIYCNSHQSRLDQQITGPDPPFAVKARKQAAIDAVSAIEGAMGSVLEDARWISSAHEAHGELAIAGNVLWRTTWEVETARVPRRNVDVDDDQQHALTLAGVELQDAMWQSVRKVTFDHEDVTTYAGVNYKIIPFEDAYILPATCRNPKNAHAIGERFVMRGSDLRREVREGRYRKEAVEELLKRTSDAPNEDRIERLETQGIDQPDWTSSGWEEEDYAEFEITELCWLGDFDGDGKLEPALLAIHVPSETLLRLQYDDYEHGRPRYTWMRYITRAGELFGMGIPELIACYQDGDTAVLNQIIDNQDLCNAKNGNYFYNRTAGLDPDRRLLGPGEPVAVDDINGILPMTIHPLPAGAYNLHQNLKDTCELLTASSNPALGKTTDAQRTLGEVQIALSATNQIFEQVAGKVALQHAEIWDQTRWLYAQFGLDPETGMVPYRRTAAPDLTEFVGITREMLTSDVDLVPAGLEQLSDMQTRIQQAMMVRSLFYPELAASFNFEGMKILNEAVLRAVKFPQAKRLMAAMEKGWMAQAQMMGDTAAAANAMAGEGEAAGAQPALPPGGGAPPPTSGPVPPEEMSALSATTPQEMPGRTSPLVQ